MPVSIEKLEEAENTYRISIDELCGESNRTYAHKLKDYQLAVASNVVFPKYGLVSKRPGNILYGGGTGHTGSGRSSLAGYRFYYGTPRTGKLIVHSASGLYVGNDANGTFTAITQAMNAGQPAHFAQARDPDMTTGSAIALFVVDGQSIPRVYDGVNFVPVQTGGTFLPNSVVGGLPIKPSYVVSWEQHIVYAGDQTDPGALYISDAMRPERFTGTSYVDSANSSYVPYYPDAQDSSLGPITGLGVLGPYLIIFFTSGIVSCLNTGSYGAVQYQFQKISTSVGAKAPQSIVAMDYYYIFYGGDHFYATDGQSLVMIPDELPSTYGVGNTGIFPLEIANQATVVGVRRSGQYWASFDSTGNGQQDTIICFDTSAGENGWAYGAPQGGAWSHFRGMSLSWGVECRGPGDSFQLFWGSSQADVIAQHDTGVFADFGQAISMEVRTKSFFLDRPTWPKTVIGWYALIAITNQTGVYTDTITPYVIYDSGPELVANSQAPIGAPITFTLTAGGTLWGAKKWGSFKWANSVNTFQVNEKGYVPYVGPGNSVAAGVTESSTKQLNLIGFALEVIVDPPQP